MSDAPAAPVTENGVPPVAQEVVVDETPGFKVFAGNLAYTTTEDGLKAFFAPVKDDILSAQIILRGTRSAGYGFVALASAEAAQKAVEQLHQKELDGRTVIIEIAKPADKKEPKEKKVKRKQNRRGSKGVPGELTEAEANGAVVAVEGGDAAAAAEEAGKAKKAKKSKRKPKKKAATTEGGETSANEGALVLAGEPAAEGEAKKPRARKPRPPRPHRAAGEEPTGEPSKTMVFVANIGFDVNEEELSKLFTDVGVKVNTARIVRRRWGKPRRSKGYGFVDVGSEEEQQKAIELLQGKEVGGRAIAVKVAVNSQKAEAEEGHAADDAEAPAAEAPADAAPAVAAAPVAVPAPVPDATA